MKIICHSHQRVNPLTQLIKLEREPNEHFHTYVCDPGGRLDFRLAGISRGWRINPPSSHRGGDFVSPALCARYGPRLTANKKEEPKIMMIRYIRALMFGVVMLAACASFAQVRVAIRFGPPALPVYEQPVCPGEDYIWVPGYWGYDYDFNDYYWVPGTWVLAPEPGFFWTPGYWAWESDAFLFHEGYWGPHVGFYGGINYG